MQTTRSIRVNLIFAALVVIAGVFVGTHYHFALWVLDDRGFSLVSRRLPYWDFANLWAGGRMALEGNISLLFDPDAYRAALRSMFSPDLPNQEWSYPPSMLLFGAPLAHLPIFPAYLIWTLGTVFCLWLAIRPLQLGWLAETAILVSPAVAMNALFGQNGALTTALLLGGLMAAPARPILAGVLFGLLTLKPHLGILAPFCLIASGNWKAILSAAATTVALTLLTAFAFGFEVWPLFWSETRKLMTEIMEAPYPQGYHSNAMTVFFLARALGADLTAAYATQALASLAAVAAAVWLWLPENGIAHRERVVATSVLAIVATPYGYTYDAIAAQVAVALLATALPNPPRLLLGLAWLYPLVAHLANLFGPAGIGVLLPIALAGWMILGMKARTNRENASSSTLEPVKPVRAS